jgi:hypothetical protein
MILSLMLEASIPYIHYQSGRMRALNPKAKPTPLKAHHRDSRGRDSRCRTPVEFEDSTAVLGRKGKATPTAKSGRSPLHPVRRMCIPIIAAGGSTRDDLSRANPI